MLTRTAGVELGSLGIRSVNIAPAAVSTPINAVIVMDPELVKRLEETIPLGRIATRFIRADHAYPHDRKAVAPARPSTSGDG